MLRSAESRRSARVRAARDRAIRGASARASPRRWRLTTCVRSGGAASVGQIAPALERAHRPRRDRDHLRLHHQAAAADAVLVAKRLDRDDLFARGDFTLDHPVERTAGEQFVVALRRHPRDVDVAKRQTLFLGGCHAFGNPALEFLDRLAADGKLDEMKRHDPADVAACARFEKITRCYQLWAPQRSARAEPALRASAGSAAAASWQRPAPARCRCGSRAWGGRGAAGARGSRRRLRRGAERRLGRHDADRRASRPRSGIRRWSVCRLASKAAVPASSARGSLRRRVPGRRIAHDQVLIDALVHVGRDLVRAGQRAEQRGRPMACSGRASSARRPSVRSGRARPRGAAPSGRTPAPLLAVATSPSEINSVIWLAA